MSITSICVVCSASATDKGCLLRCARCKSVLYCSKKCQRLHWKKGGHKKECRPPFATITKILQIMDRTADRWLESLNFTELMSFYGVSKWCGNLVKTAPHLFQDINIRGTTISSFGRFPSEEITDDTMLRLWRLCGDQIRSLSLHDLPKITAKGLALLCDQPHLHTLSIRNCEQVVASLLMKNIYLNGTLRSLRNVNLNGCQVVTSTEINALHDRGVTKIDHFICQKCHQASRYFNHACTFKGCQPSTNVLCSECADTKTCQQYGGKNNVIQCISGCEECTNGYEDWSLCSMCDNASCDECWGDILFCESCDECFCEECREVYLCSECCEGICDECCSSSTFCACCEECFCEDCRLILDCDHCGESYCEDCHFVKFCSECSTPSCGKDECPSMLFCEACEDFYCEGCFFEHTGRFKPLPLVGHRVPQ